MKQNLNAFKAARFSTVTRFILVGCLAMVLVVGGLFFSLPDERSWMRSLFRTEREKTDPVPAGGDDTGILGAATVNEGLRVRPMDQEDHIWGPISAPVQLIVYDDFECPFCAQLYDSIQQAKAEFGSELAVVVRHFPLASHTQAIPAAIAAECAAEQDKFWEMYHELFADNKAGRLSPEEIRSNGATIGLAEPAYSECLTDERYKDKILAEKDEIKMLGVIGTPASFINSEYLAGALPYEDFTHPDGTNALGLRSLIAQKLNQ